MIYLFLYLPFQLKMGNSPSHYKAVQPNLSGSEEEPIRQTEGIITKVTDEFCPFSRCQFECGDSGRYYLYCNSKNFSKAYLMIKEGDPVRVYWKYFEMVNEHTGDRATECRVLDIERAVCQVHITYAGSKDHRDTWEEIVPFEALKINNRYIHIILRRNNPLYERINGSWKVGSSYQLTVEMHENPNIYRITEALPNNHV